jgi:hypothetical protein
MNHKEHTEHKENVDSYFLFFMLRSLDFFAAFEDFPGILCVLRVLGG